jgi:hypothetical protein
MCFYTVVYKMYLLSTDIILISETRNKIVWNLQNKCFTRIKIYNSETRYIIENKP